jgi:hypothetical protein
VTILHLRPEFESSIRMRAAPHRKQDRSAGSGAAKGSNCAGAAIKGMA